MAKRKPYLEAYLNSRAIQTIYLMQYDTTELTCVVYMSDKKPLDLSGMSVTLMAAYNNKVIATQTFVVTDSGNIITMGLSPAFVQHDGKITMQLIFRDSFGDQISTYMFYANVAKNLLGCGPGQGAGDPPFMLGTSDYNDLTNKPTINGKELVGDVKIKTAYDSAVAGGYTGDEETFDRILCVMAEIVTCLSDSHKYVLGSDD